MILGIIYKKLFKPHATMENWRYCMNMLMMKKHSEFISGRNLLTQINYLLKAATTVYFGQSMSSNDLQSFMII